MDIVPILQTFRFNKGAVALITAQIAFTLAVLVNALVVIDAYRARLQLETGINDRQVVAVEVEPIDRSYFDDDGRVRNDVQQDIDRLRRIDGVRSVSQVASFPLSGEGAMRPSWPEGTAKEKAIRHSIYGGDTDMFPALGLNVVAGRTFTAEEVNWLADPLQGERAPVIIVSRDLAEMLFPGVDAIGKQVETEGGRVDTVVGIVDRLPGRHVLMNSVKLAAIVPGRSLTSMRYAIGTNDDATPALLEQISTALLERDGARELRVDTLIARKTQSMHYLFLFGSILGGISVLLILVTAIGAYSQAAYSVSKRIKQIGTRRAFGASRLHILRYFLLENWLTTTIGLAVGLLIASALSFILTQAMDVPKVGWTHLLVGMLFLWVTGIVSTLIPALRAARVPPAIATRTAG